MYKRLKKLLSVFLTLAMILTNITFTLKPLRIQAEVTDSGLEAWYKLDEATGVIALDSSGKGNHSLNEPNGTSGLKDTCWMPQSGKIKGAIQLNGSDHSIRLSQGITSPNVGFLHEAFKVRSVSLWLKANNTSGIQTLFEQGGNGAGFAIQINNGKLQAGIAGKLSDGKTVERHSIETVFTDTTSWHKAVVVFNNGDFKLYLDGELKGSKDKSKVNFTEIPGAPNDGGIGRRFGVDAFENNKELNGQYFNGMIDDVRLYTKDITTIGAPGKVTNSLVGAGNKQLILNWENPIDVDGKFEKVNIYKVMEDKTLTLLDSSFNNSYIVNGLNNEEEYTYELRSVGIMGNEAEGVRVSGTPIASELPKVNDAAAAPGDGKITLSWTNPVDEKFEKVDIYKVSNNSASLVTSTAGTSYTVEGLSNGATYTFELKAIYTNGEQSEGVRVSGRPAGIYPKVTIDVDPKKKESWSIAKLIFGRFQEHNGRDIYPGLMDMHMANGSFEDYSFPVPGQESRTEILYRDMTQYKGLAYPWEPIVRNGGDLNNITYTMENGGVNGTKFQRVAVNGSENAGMKQRVALEDTRTKNYKVEFYVRAAEGSNAPLKVSIEDSVTGEILATETINISEVDWSYKTIELTLSKESSTRYLNMPPYGQHALVFEWNPTNTLDFDYVLLWAGDAVDGKYNPTTIENLKDYKVASMRWPGGNFTSSYLWQDGVGPMEDRPVNFNKDWKGLEPNYYGTIEYLEFSRLSGMTPMINIGFNSTIGPEMAANWVEYVNGSVDTPMGALRASHGYPEPWGVKNWQVGNEVYGTYQYGHVDAATFAKGFIEYYDAMKAKDPSITIIAAGADPDYYEWKGSEWNDELYKTIGEKIDAVDMHRYVTGIANETDRNNNWTPQEYNQTMVLYPTLHEEALKETLDHAKNLGAPNVKFNIGEWNLGANYSPGWPQANYGTMAHGSFVAGMYNTYIRMGDVVKWSYQRDNTLYDRAYPIDTRPINVGSEVLKLFSDVFYSEAKEYKGLPVTQNSPVTNTRAMLRMRAGQNVPYVDTSAVISDDNEAYLFITNRNLTESYTAEVKLKLGWTIDGDAEAVVLSSIDGNALTFNSWDNKAYVQETIDLIKDESGRVSIDLTPGAVARIKLNVKQGGEETAPDAPSNLKINELGGDYVKFSWDVPKGNIGAVAYAVYRNGVEIGDTTELDYTDYKLEVNKNYQYTVVAYDLGGNPSKPSEPLEVIIKGDIIKPQVPSKLIAENILNDAVALKWQASTDNVGVTGYEIYRDGVMVGTTTEASYIDKTVEENKTYKYSVAAYDAAGNKSDKSAELVVLIIKGIEAYYRLDEVSGTTAYDSAGKNNNGKLSGNPTWKPSEGKVGGALAFDGVDDAVQLVPDGPSGFMHDAFEKRTFSIWFKADTTSGTRTLLDQGGNGSGIAMHIKDGALKAAVRSTDPEGKVVQTTVETPFTDTNSWHNAIVAFNLGTLKLYLDGSLVDSKTAPYTKVNSHVNQGGFGARFGFDALGGPSGIGDYFKGMIDEVRFYNTDITDGMKDTTAPAEVKGVKVIPGNAVLNLTWTDPTDFDFAKIKIIAAGQDNMAPIYVTKGAQKAEISGLKNGTAYRLIIQSVDSSENESKGITVEGTPSDFIISSPIITNSYGDRIEVLQGNTELKASVTVANYTASEKPITLIAALYDRNNAMKDIKFVEGNAGLGETTISLGNENLLGLAEATEGDYVNIFLWESIENMKPISKVTKIPFNKTIDKELFWEDDIVEVFKASSGGASYPRVLQLDNGDLLCTVDTNEDGGFSAVKVMRSTDKGRTWEKAVTATYLPEYKCANGQLLQLRNGEIWLSYRAVKDISGDTRYTSLRVNKSKDGGKTWEDHSLIIENEGIGGVWEPHLGYLGDKIAVFYANDSLNKAVNTRGQQNIEFKIWEGDKWSDKYIAVDGIKSNSRDGMPVWDRMEDGRYIMIFEATDTPGYPFVVRYKISEDGYNWDTERHLLYVPNVNGKKAGAPYIIKLSDGRLAAAFHTDESTVAIGDPVSTMKVMVSKDKTGDQWGEPFIPFLVPHGSRANWNALFETDKRLMAVTSSNYPAAGVYIRNASLEPITEPGKNVINNGDFHVGTIQGWMISDGKTKWDLSVGNTFVDKENENYFMRIQNKNDKDLYITQSVRGVQRGTYTLTAKVKADKAIKGLTVTLKQGDASITKKFDINNEFNQILIPDLKFLDGMVELNILLPKGESITLDVDDVQMVKGN